MPKKKKRPTLASEMMSITSQGSMSSMSSSNNNLQKEATRSIRSTSAGIRASIESRLSAAYSSASLKRSRLKKSSTQSLQSSQGSISMNAPQKQQITLFESENPQLDDNHKMSTIADSDDDDDDNEVEEVVQYNHDI